MRRAGVNVPEPIAFSGNILVMEFLGEEGYRAPLLVEVIEELPVDTIEKMYKQVIEQMKLIVCKAKLVHVDLSEYNIMLWQGKPWIIDVSQAVEHSHPLAKEFLERDISNITRFFTKYTDLDLEDEVGEAKKCLATE
jgi:RIO kinase 1